MIAIDMETQCWESRSYGGGVVETFVFKDGRVKRLVSIFYTNWMFGIGTTCTGWEERVERFKVYLIRCLVQYSIDIHLHSQLFIWRSISISLMLYRCGMARDASAYATYHGRLSRYSHIDTE